MRVAIIGSRRLEPSEETIGHLLPSGTTEIVSGGAPGTDQAAYRYAKSRGLALTEIRPDYSHSRDTTDPQFVPFKLAPLKRNERIIAYADLVLAFWDGTSHGTRHVIQTCLKTGTPVRVFLPVADRWEKLESDSRLLKDLLAGTTTLTDLTETYDSKSEAPSTRA